VAAARTELQGQERLAVVLADLEELHDVGAARRSSSP